jgi:apolipoprotein N-acyltransferase
MGLPMRLAPIVGVYGLSFVFAMLACAVALVALRRPRLQLAWLAALAVLFLLPALPDAEPGTHEAVSVQPNIAMDEIWTAQKVFDTRQQLAYLSLETALAADAERPDLIVWPESPAPLYYESDREFREEANNLARLTGTYFLFGTVAHAPGGRPLNSAQLISPAGAPVARYDKMFLVPFGEFIPPGFSWMNRITQEGSDFVSGETVQAPQLGDHHIGIFICYESVFPHLVRQFAREGGEVFFNLSNDGYFGTTAAREQHLFIARMRAAENRRWLVRSTNNGITVSIDPAGRLLATAPEHVRTAVRLPFDYISETTFYTQYGDWFAWICLAASLALVVHSWIPQYRRD